MKKPISLLGKILLFFSFSTGLLHGGSYSVTLPANSYLPLAWSFQNSTVGTAFPSAPTGSQIQVWNPTTSSYSSATKASWGWNAPSLGLTNGTGFYFLNTTGASMTVTVSGTNVTASSVLFTYEAGKQYLVAQAYMIGDLPLYCVADDNGIFRYTNILPSQNVITQSAAKNIGFSGLFRHRL